MSILHLISGPLIGAVIGYCTNYIAVKMLFRPLKAIKIGRFTLPFTPGMIPKRKNELAAAVGKAVGSTLLTENDMAAMLMSEDVENAVVDACAGQLSKLSGSEAKVGEILSATIGENEYGQAKEQITKSISEKLMVKIQEMEPRRIVAEESKKIARQKLEGTMFGMFIGGDKINALAEEIGIYAENYIIDNGFPYIEEQVEKEIAGLEDKSLREVGEWVQADGDTVRKKICEIYRACIEKFASSIVGSFHIAGIVEQKIRDMDVKTLEELVMSVMKRELKMIVNLGALIGLILGCINLLL